MNKLLYGLLLFITIGFVSCETDVDINADYEDMTIVYGVVDPADTNHYIKINKSFLGDVSALDLAADASNFDYDAGELDVTIEADGNTQTLTRVTNEIPKDEGTFDNNTNVLYKFTGPIDIYKTYKLKIYNAELDKEITSETKIVGNTIVSAPSKNSKFNFWNGSGDYYNKTFSITTGSDVGRVEAFLVFNYSNVFTVASGKPSEQMRVLMPLGVERTTTSLGNESLEWSLKGETFFDNVSAGVPSYSGIADFSHRSLEMITLEFFVVGTELSTYMEVNAPSTSVNQDKPGYTNITNGLGILSSSNRIYWESDIPPTQGDIHDYTIGKLAGMGLGFCFGTSPTGEAPCPF